MNDECMGPTRTVSALSLPPPLFTSGKVRAPHEPRRRCAVRGGRVVDQWVHEERVAASPAALHHTYLLPHNIMYTHV